MQCTINTRAACARRSIVRDFLKIPIRVDFLPVTFYDPFYTPRLGSSNQLSIVPQMGSHLTTKMDFGQRIHNTIVHMVNNAIIDYIADPIADELRQRCRVRLALLVRRVWLLRAALCARAACRVLCAACRVCCVLRAPGVPRWICPCLCTSVRTPAHTSLLLGLWLHTSRSPIHAGGK